MNIRDIKIRAALLAIQLCAGVALLATLITALPAFARAGTLLKCEGISTQQGYKFIGTYCVDYQCRYTTTRVFDGYCPYTL